jgi:ABC-type transport system involved in multi-copper enzyme maturation permease subunit
MRWGLGPVFIYECLANSRRWQTYALRSVGVAALLFAMGTIATSTVPTMGNSARDYANLGQAYFIAMIGVELALVILAAPAATAGAICVDRARGTLDHMLMTELSDTEIVLGKLAARLLPVFGLVACTWPVMAISSLLGGIDPIALTLAFAIIVAVAVLGCTIALALSVWARKTHEVILATYTAFILGVLLWPVWTFLSMAGQVGAPPPWALLSNPFYVAFAPYADPGKLDFWDYLVFFGVALVASALLSALAVWRTRPVARRGSAEKSKGPRIGLFGRMTRWLPGPSLDRNPVLWREWHRSRPSRWMTAILALLMGTTGALCIAGAVAFWKNGVELGPRPATWELAGIFSYILHLIFGLLMLAAIAPTSMAEERQRGSLDMLAATALSTRAIVIGKWLGTFRLVLLMAIGPGLMALAMATARSGATFAPGPGLPPDYYRVFSLGARCYGVIVVIATIVAHGALIASVGLAMAVWIKRQSRAIAMSVGSFILVTAAWPIVVSIPFLPELGRNLASLSPVVTCVIFVNFFTNRTYAFMGGMLWCGTFWAVEVFALALGLLWLTVWTFDGCFERIPDRPRRVSVWTVVVTILAGMIGAGSLVGAIDCWVEGVEPQSLSWPTSFGITAYFLLIAIGLVLVAVESAKSGRLEGTTVAAMAPGLAARSFVLGRWWKSFRLVLLLAIGPALLALALATAHKAWRYEPQFTKNASGAQVISSYVPAKADIPYVGEVRRGQRLLIATVLIVTILVHGGAAISVGLGLTTANRWSRRALASVVGLIFLVLLVLPVCLTLVNSFRAPDVAMWSFITAADSLLEVLVTRTSFSALETLWSVTFCDLVIALFAVGLSCWMIWVWQRRLSGVTKAQPLLATDLHDSQPAAETALIGD